MLIVIVNSKLLKRHSKAKRRAPAYSRVLHQIRGVFQRIVNEAGMMKAFLPKQKLDRRKERCLNRIWTDD